MNEAAAEAGISAGIVRADINRGRWPDEDAVRNGRRLWKRSTVRATMAARRANKRCGAARDR